MTKLVQAKKIASSWNLSAGPCSFDARWNLSALPARVSSIAHVASSIEAERRSLQLALTRAARRPRCFTLNERVYSSKAGSAGG
jgi:hypothetical protein